MIYLAQLLSLHGDPLTPSEVKQVAKATAGYSGSDLTNLARDAAFGPLRDIPTEKLVTVKASDLRSIQLEDFRSAIVRVRSSIEQRTLQIFQDWNTQFGDVS